MQSFHTKIVIFANQKGKIFKKKVDMNEVLICKSLEPMPFLRVRAALSNKSVEKTRFSSILFQAFKQFAKMYEIVYANVKL